MNKRWIIIAGALALGSSLLLGSAFLRRPDAGLHLHEVDRGALRVWTVYDGAIQSRSVRGVSSQLGGGATVTDLVPEGTPVSAGDSLVRLDASALERDLVRMERDFTLARAEYDSLTKARLPLERREMEMRLLQARAELQEAEDALADLNELIAENLLPAQDAVQQDKKNVMLRTAVENLEQQLALTLDHLHPAALERAEAQRASAEREWTLAKEQMESSLITAPSDGVVVYQPVAVGSEFRTIRVGDTVYKNQVFISLPDMSNLIVQVDVPEHELTLAQVGRLVSVQPLAYPGMSLAGVVESVGSMAQTRPDRPGRQKFFTVVIRLTEVRPELKSGMSARVHILSHDEPDALLVPRAAITWENNEAYCTVMRDSQPQRVRVVTGAAGATEVAVVAGLEPGQRVVLP
jgi:multidrug efflux pump subunit AcrA (membrane-fusion protein)